MSSDAPIKCLYDAIGHIITLETKDGETYRGKLVSAELDMNCHLQSVDVTYSDGRKGKSSDIYVRGSSVVFCILPDAIQFSPQLKPKEERYRGKVGILIAQATREERNMRKRRYGKPPKQPMAGPSKRMPRK